MLVLALLGCGPDVAAIYDPARPEHYFDVPFPSNDLLDADGFPDLDGWPLAGVQLTANVERGWADRLELTAQGFGNNTAAYFRFDGALELPATTEGTPEDPVLWVALDGSELLPLDVRFVRDPLGDMHWGRNTLVMVPTLGHPPRSGVTYAAVVMRSAGVQPPDGWEAPEAVTDALKAAGVKGKPAIATVFTVQDAAGQLKQLADDVDTRLGDWGEVTYRRVVEIEYAAGETPSGKEATVFTARFEDGGERVAWLGFDPNEAQVIDLADWPMLVYEADLPVLVYQPADDRPYMDPGLQHVGDIERMSGWIDFVGGQLVSEPWVDSMRFTVQIPKNTDGGPVANAPVVIWDHGTGGHAYNIVQRANANDDSRALAEVFANEGWAVIGHDATLYGTRYPLIDEGYGASLGFYNIVNLPAFRDNQRQTAIEGHQLRRYVEQQLSADLGVSVDTTRIRRAGHSLGSVTSNLGVASDPEGWESTFLSGTGGVYSHYFLDTGLLATIDPATVASLFPLFGVEAPETITTQSVAGAALGLQDPEAWTRIDRTHPLLTLFQWTMDPSDPMAVARDEALPTFLSISPGDFQTPDFTAEALGQAQPQATVRHCEARGDYDPHNCLWREPEGPEILREWLQTAP